MGGSGILRSFLVMKSSDLPSNVPELETLLRRLTALHRALETGQMPGDQQIQRNKKAQMWCENMWNAHPTLGIQEWRPQNTWNHQLKTCCFICFCFGVGLNWYRNGCSYCFYSYREGSCPLNIWRDIHAETLNCTSAPHDHFPFMYTERKWMVPFSIFQAMTQ